MLPIAALTYVTTNPWDLLPLSGQDGSFGEAGAGDEDCSSCGSRSLPQSGRHGLTGTGHDLGTTWARPGHDLGTTWARPELPLRNSEFDSLRWASRSH